MSEHVCVEGAEVEVKCPAQLLISLFFKTVSFQRFWSLLIRLGQLLSGPRDPRVCLPNAGITATLHSTQWYIGPRVNSGPYIRAASTFPSKPISSASSIIQGSPYSP